MYNCTRLYMPFEITRYEQWPLNGQDITKCYHALLEHRTPDQLTAVRQMYLRPNLSSHQPHMLEWTWSSNCTGKESECYKVFMYWFIHVLFNGFGWFPHAYFVLLPSCFGPFTFDPSLLLCLLTLHLPVWLISNFTTTKHQQKAMRKVIRQWSKWMAGSPQSHHAHDILIGPTTSPVIAQLNPSS